MAPVPGQGYTIKTQVDEVDLNFTVTDRHGHFIDNLQQKDFALLDNGRAPAQIYRFEQETNLPLRVGLLIDTSTSIRQRFQFEQQAATAFLLQILRPQTDKAFVEGFDIQPDFTQNWTSNLDALTSGVEALHPGGGTALYDSLYIGCHDKMLTASTNHEPSARPSFSSLTATTTRAMRTWMMPSRSASAQRPACTPSARM